MAARKKSRFGVGEILFIFFLFFPYWRLFVQVPHSHIPWSPEVVEVFFRSTVQAGLSSLASLIFGIWGAFGLIWFYRRLPRRGWLVDALALAPNLFPPVFIILAVLNVIPQFPFGLTGTVICHALINSGLVALVLGRIFIQRLSGAAELAEVEGAGSWTFLRYAVFKNLRTEWLYSFFFVFCLCFTSFAIPLVLGGSQAVTLEVMIYEHIRIFGDWSGALGLSLLQFFFIFLFGSLLGRPVFSGVIPISSAPRILSHASGLVPIGVPILILIGGLVAPAFKGWKVFVETDILSWTLLGTLIRGSFLTGILAGTLVLVLLLILGYLAPRGWFHRLLFGYVTPSTVISGMALLFLPFSDQISGYLRIVIGLSMIFVPAFYRLHWASVLQRLEPQRQVAETLGSRRWLAFYHITLPQMIRPACFLAGVASFWTWGDFALSSVVADHNITLGLTVKSLIDSYRLELATFLIGWILIGGLSQFLIFMGLGYVYRTEH